MNKYDIIFVFSLIICSLFLSVNTIKLNKLRVSAKPKTFKFSSLLQKDNQDDLHGFFNYIDADGNGKINETEIRDAVHRLRANGQNDLPSDSEIHRYFEDHHLHDLDFHQFEQMVREENNHGHRD